MSVSGRYSSAYAGSIAEIDGTGATRSLGNRTRASFLDRVFGIG